jgi:hypothetical protein
MNSAVKAFSTAVPSSALTATASRAVPSGTAKAILEGFTLKTALTGSTTLLVMLVNSEE